MGLRSLFRQLLFPVLSVFALGATGCAQTTTVGKTAEGAPIVRIPLRLSSVYLVKTKPVVLIDSGTLGDMDDLRRGLSENGVRVSELGLVIVTHGHADHAGLAHDLRDASPARVILGAGDLPLAAAGTNDDLQPMNFSGKVLKPFITGFYPAFTPDFTVSENDPIDLHSIGIDGKVIAMPGHTKGSLVVVLGNHSAFVGDMMAGGALGGLLFPGDPNEHYYQADPAQNRRNIATLVGMGVETFYLGHGGPVSRADVISTFALAAK
jgi:glyoxylase-like metal-dependent hydrolase (beta-lactamase superfamily II)